MVNSRIAFAAIVCNSQCFILQSSSVLTIIQIFKEIDKIETFARQYDFDISFYTESDALESIKDSSKVVLIVPSLTKKEVIKAALDGEVFTQKTTRHVVPARPLFVNVPVKWLNQSDAETINLRMKQYLESKQIVQLEPGAIIEGRRYEEYAYVFKDL